MKLLPIQPSVSERTRMVIQKTVRKPNTSARLAFIPHLLCRCHMGISKRGVQMNICISAARYQQCPRHCGKGVMYVHGELR